MTILADRPSVFADSPEPEPEHEHGPTGILKWITSTDHKVIGKSYTITAVVFFLMAGCMALPSWRARTAPCCRNTPTTRCSRCTAA